MYNFNNTAMINFVENTLIPDVMEQHEKGFFSYAYSCDDRFPINATMRAITERTGFKCDACGGTIYIKIN